MEVLEWYDRYAIRAEGRIGWLFLDKEEKILLDSINSESSDVGQLSETLYNWTGKISPLRVIQFLVNTCRAGLLANGRELAGILSGIDIRPESERGSVARWHIRGLNSDFGAVFLMLFFAAAIVMALFSNGALPAPSLYPFAGNAIQSLLIFPVAILVLTSLRGLFTILFFLCIGKRGDLILSATCGMLLLSMEKRCCLSAPPHRRRLYHIALILFFPLVMLILSAIYPYLPRPGSTLAQVVFWVSAVMFLFDLYLLHDSLSIRALEELSMETGLAGEFKNFWKRGFATVESLFEKKFDREELFYSMGLFQLVWFAPFWIVVVYALKESFPEVMYLYYEHSAEKGWLFLIPWAAAAVSGAVFFLATVVPFVLRKAAWATVSLFELSSSLGGHKESAGKAMEGPIDLRQIYAFGSLSDDEVRDIEAAATVAECGAEEELIREGDEGDSLYAIREGTAVVYRNIGGGRTKELALLGKGDVFGERAILGDGRRTASVKSISPMQFYRIPAETFLKVAENISEKGRLSDIIMASNAIHSTSIFSELPPQTVIDFASRVELKNIDSGTAILTEGQKSDGLFYIIKSGKAAVAGAAPGGGDVTLGAKDYFGEIALLNDSPRTANVTAQSDMEVFVFKRQDFLKLLLSNFNLLLGLESKGRKRLSELVENR